jgi:hypothetical protein
MAHPAFTKGKPIVVIVQEQSFARLIYTVKENAESEKYEVT